MSNEINGIKPQGKPCTHKEFEDSHFSAPDGRGIKPFVSTSLGRCVNEDIPTRSSLVEIKNITDNIMDQIHSDKIKMKPRMYFVIGSVLTFVGLVSSVVVSVFLLGLMRFSLRSHGPMADYRSNQILSSFPWWAPLLAILGLVTGIWLLRKYDFSFKINFKVIIIGFILAVIVGGFVIDSIGLNDVLIRRGPMQGMMRQYLSDTNNEGIQNAGYGKNKNR